MRHAELRAPAAELLVAIAQYEQSKNPADHVKRLESAMRAFTDVAHVDAGWQNATLQNLMLPSKKAARSIAERLTKGMLLAKTEARKHDGWMLGPENPLFQELFLRGANEIAMSFLHLFSTLYEARKNNSALYFIANYEASDRKKFEKQIRSHVSLEKVRFITDAAEYKTEHYGIFKVMQDYVAGVESSKDVAFVLFFQVSLPDDDGFLIPFAAEESTRSWGVYPKSVVGQVCDFDKNVLVENKHCVCWYDRCKKVVSYTSKCSKCMLATYCSYECHQKDWKRHKEQCKEIVAKDA